MTLSEGTTAPIVLASNRLKVEIASPGSVYQRTRFDWTGFITQVTLDGKHTFCVPEDYDPEAGTGGIGICNEFGIEKAIGYADTTSGESFPKLGIGLLTRADEAPYNFFKPYDIASKFEIHIEAGPDRVCFTVDPEDCRGYAARETKTISLRENCLQIDTQLDNVGRLPLVTHEYAHNFIGIDQAPTGPGYCLRLPYAVTLEQAMQVNLDILQIEGSEIRWKATPQKPFYCRPTGFQQTRQPQWELIYEPAGVGMREIDDFSPARVALWGAAHVISAEIFIDIDLEPGKSQSWSRRYEFFD